MDPLARALAIPSALAATLAATLTSALLRASAAGARAGTLGASTAQMAIGESFFVPVVIVPTRNGHADDFFNIAQVFQFVFGAE